MRSGKTTVFGRGENPVNFVSARDVARFVELALHEPDLSRRSLDVGGPDNLTFNEVVRRIEAAADRKAKVRYIPAGLMRLARPLLRPMRPDLAGMVEAGIATDSADMRFDATPLQQRFPGVVLTPLTDVIRERFGEPAAGLSV